MGEVVYCRICHKSYHWILLASRRHREILLRKLRENKKRKNKEMKKKGER